MNTDTSSDLNQDIANSLDSYIQGNVSEFAILLTGEWGSGKTFFIKQYIENYTKNAYLPYFMETIYKKHNIKIEEKIAFCYISLFEIKSLGEIDSRIITQTSTLFSEKNKQLGRLASWGLDKALHFIPHGGIIGHATKALGGILKSIFDKFPENIVLILDDIERSSLDIKDILGYCHNMLTINKSKIILLADESKLSENANNENSTYKEFKEKIIGKTLCVVSDPALVFDITVENFSSDIYKKVVKDYKDILLDWYIEHNFKNLRVLQYFVYEAEIFLSHIGEEYLNNTETTVTKDILISLFQLTFMHNVDRISIKDLNLEKMTNILYGTNKTTEEKNLYRKYCNIREQIVFIEDWNELLQGKYVYKNITQKFIQKYLFESKNKELEEVLWNLNNEEFQKKLKAIEQKLSDKQYTSAQEIIACTKYKFILSGNGLLDDSYSDIATEMIEYIESIDIEKAKFLSYPDSRYDFLSVTFPDVYIGMPEFQNIIEKLKETMDKLYEKDKKPLIKSFLNSLERIAEFRNFVGKNMERATLFKLYDINANEFLTKLIPCSNKNGIFLECNNLWDSYNHIDSKDDCPTCNWWVDFHNAFQTKQDISDFDKTVIRVLCENASLGAHVNPFKKDNPNTDA